MANLKRLFRYDLPLHAVLLLTNWLPDLVIFLRIRGKLASYFIGQCGKDLRLGRNVTLYNSQNIRIGSNVYIAHGCWFSADDLITLEDEVILGPNTIFASSNHSKQGGSFRYGEAVKGPITISKGTWVGAQCCILVGTKVGSGSLIACNSVVNKSFPADSLIAGSPAHVVKNV